MNKKPTILIGIVIIVIISAVAGYLFWSPRCPESCDDGNPCTQNTCSKETNYKCQAKFIPNCCGNTTCETEENYESCSTDCPNCDDNNECTKDSYDYHEQKCVNAPILTTICCGNTVCETSENYQSCSRDCPNCNDNNKCTRDSYDYHKQVCINETIIPCCGNGICDKGAETYSSCSADCPNCNDNNKLTADSFNYTSQKCAYTVTHYFIDDFESGIQNWDIGMTEDPTGAWSTRVDGSNTVFRGVNHNWTTLSGEGWSDYVFKARFKIIKGQIHFNYRVTQKGGQPNRYFIGLSSGHLNLSKQIGETFYSNIAETTGVNFGSGWHTIEIRGYGDIINVLVDGGVLIKYKDAQNPVLSGTVGLETHEGSEYWIDDVEIKVISQKDIIYP